MFLSNSVKLINIVIRIVTDRKLDFGRNENAVGYPFTIKIQENRFGDVVFSTKSYVDYTVVNG